MRNYKLFYVIREFYGRKKISWEKFDQASMVSMSFARGCKIIKATTQVIVWNFSVFFFLLSQYGIFNYH